MLEILFVCYHFYSHFFFDRHHIEDYIFVLDGLVLVFVDDGWTVFLIYFYKSCDNIRKKEDESNKIIVRG